MRTGDTIKCHDLEDMFETKNDLERAGIYTDVQFPVSDYTLVIWKVKEGGGL